MGPFLSAICMYSIYIYIYIYIIYIFNVIYIYKYIYIYIYIYIILNIFKVDTEARIAYRGIYV